MIDFDYSFCSAQCKNATCYRNQANLPKGERVIFTMSDFSNTDVCPLFQKGEDDEQIPVLYSGAEQAD